MTQPVTLADIARQVSQDLERKRARQAADWQPPSLRDFIAQAWRIAEPAAAYVPGWHIDAIADHLEACTRLEIRRLIINIPPRHMKSLAVSVFWPVHRWTFDPHVRFLTASYGQALATRDAVKSRRLIQSPWFQRTYGHVFRLTGDQNEKTRYENDRTGYRIATSVGGTATGEGGDVIVIDDPHKADEVVSDTKRQAVLDWHDQTISTRFNDPDTGVEVIVMQRLHEHDLTGHLLERGGWTHLCLPAEYDPKHPFLWPDDPRDTPGDLLWPDHINRQALEDIKKPLGSYGTAGQLQQLPAPLEGGLLKRAWWRYYQGLPEGRVALIQSWDTAFRDKTSNDYCVGQLWAVVGADRYLVRLARGRWDLVETLQQVRDMTRWAYDQFGPAGMSVLIENAANGPDVIAQLRREISGIMPVTPKGDKTQRVVAVSPQIEAGNVFLPGVASPDGTGCDTARTPEWVQEFIDECVAFPNAAHDDQVDAMTQALIRATVSSATVTDFDVDRDDGGQMTGFRPGMSLMPTF